MPIMQSESTEEAVDPAIVTGQPQAEAFDPPRPTVTPRPPGRRSAKPDPLKLEPTAAAEAKPDLAKDEDAAEIERKPNVRSTAPAPRSTITPRMLELKKADQIEVNDWIASLAGETSIQVIVKRVDPKVWNDPITGDQKKVDGTIQTYDRKITEEEIQQRHGGGLYQLIVRNKNERGQWEYFAARTVNIAGDPRIDDVPRARSLAQPTVATPAADPMANDVMKMMTSALINGQNRPAPSPGLDTAALQAIIGPLNATIAGLQAQLLQKEELHAKEVQSIRETAGRDPFRDQMLTTMMGGESSRIKALTEAHASEVRQLKEGFIQAEARIRDQSQRDIDRLERAHERELATIKSANELAVKMLEQGAKTQQAVLEREIATATKQIEKLEVELADFRKKHNPSFKEKVEEMQAMQDLIGGDDDDKESTITKVISAVGNLPAIGKMAERLGGGTPPAPQVQQAPAPPPRPRLVRDAAGEVFMQTPRGLVPMKKKPQQITTTAGTRVQIPAVDPEDVKTAVTFMEGAFRSNTDAETFAATARPMIPQAVLGALRQLGADEFMSQVAKMDGTSPLSTQGGRNWVRRVARVLLGEDTSKPDAVNEGGAESEESPSE